MRAHLSDNFGKMVQLEHLTSELKGCEMLMSVGDMVSYTLLENNFRPDILIYDLKTERRSFTSLARSLVRLNGVDIKVKNPAGQITTELVSEISKAIDRAIPTKIQVEGEEDLAALACAAMAPLGSCLMYGIPGKGMALVKIDIATSGHARSLIYAMEELN